MELSSSDEENCQLEFWNNWSPFNESYFFNENQCKTKCAEKILFKSPKIESVKSLMVNHNFGNWVPPLNFLNMESKYTKKIISPSNLKYNQKEGALSDDRSCKSDGRSYKIIRETERGLENERKYLNNIEWKKKVNLDWGERVLLNDVSTFNDGNLIWGIVNLGMFVNIKLWVNEYGNISGLADGKISKLGCSEITYVCIRDIQLLRKMLSLSNAQWTSICEIVQETKTTLKFDAFQDCNMANKSHLEKLWFFVCKRRHFLTPQCMLLKICGAVKCMRKFQIISKLVVQDIRNLLGEPIL